MNCPFRFPRLTLLGIVLVPVVFCVRAADTPDSAPRVIRNFGDFWTVPETEKTQPQPLRMEVVTYFVDANWRVWWGESDGVTGFLPVRAGVPFVSGQRCLIEGTVVPADGLQPELIRVTVLDPEVEIQPRELPEQYAKIADAASALSSQMVAIEAYVTRQDIIDDQHVALTLAMDGFQITARVLGDIHQQREDLRSRLVRVQGVFIPNWDPAGNFNSANVWVSAPGQVEVMGRLESDPRFDIAATAIEDLGSVDPGARVRIVGSVHAYDAGRSMVLRDPTGQAQFKVSQMDAVRPGELIEAIGIPVERGLDWRLEAVLFRRPASEAAPLSTADVDSLRFVDQIHRLSPAQTVKGFPVKLWGVVTWAKRGGDFLYVQDASGGIRVDLPPDRPSDFEVGMAVTVQGVTAAGDYAPHVQASSVDAPGSRLTAASTPVTAEQALSGLLPDARIELKGFVAAVVDDGPWARMTLRTSAGEIEARMVADERVSDLLNSVVRVRGVCEVLANDQRQLTGIQLWVQSFADVQVDAVMPADPFALEMRSIHSLRQFNSVHLRDHWTKTSGVVTNFVAGQSLTIQNDSNGLLVLTHQAEALDPGDVIEVVGLPKFDGSDLVMSEAVYRSTGRKAEVSPRALSSSNEIAEQNHNLLVAVTGTFVDYAPEMGDVRLSIESDSTSRMFTAMLPREAADLDLLANLPGSRVRLQGVYFVKTVERQRTRDFYLILRSMNDLVVLKAAPWWTPRRTWSVAAILGALLVIGLWRVSRLSGRLEQQSVQIESHAAVEAHLRARSEQIVAKASDGIVTTGVDGRITSSNHAGERITGYRKEELVGREIGSFLTIADCTAEVPRDGRPVDAVDGSTYQCQFRKRDGSEIWVEISWNEIVSDTGEPGLMAIIRDISERKEFEEELKRTRDAAEANAAAKSMFLANMSHELRTPMNGVIGMSNLLLDTKLDGEQKEFALTVRNSAESLLTVLNDILDFSKIEAGRLDLEILIFDAHEVVGEALELLAPRAAAKNIELATHLSSKLPRSLRGDPGRLRQILLNLLGNAVKFTELGDIAVTASVVADDPAGLMVRFVVCDTGPGLDREAIARLFRPFSQADNSTTRRFGGTGLGLAISKQIVELMSGKIGVESVPGQGATFWFEVPFFRAASSACEPIALPPGIRLLGLDSNETRRQMLRDYAAAWRAQVEFVDQPSEVLPRLGAAGASFDVFLLDAEHPGIDLAGFFQQNATLLGSTRIILFQSMFERLPSLEIAGIQIHAAVNKPVSVDEVSRALARVTGVREESDNPASVAPHTAPDSGVTDQSPLRILVAEDNVVNQRVITLWLKKIGYTADVVANGLEVLEALERKEYDVVLMDCQMPEMDGYQATQHIRQNGDYRSLRIIAMTANAMQGDREECLAVGMDDYLSKPCKIDDLRAALLRCAHQSADRG